MDIQAGAFTTYKKQRTKKRADLHVSSSFVALFWILLFFDIAAHPPSGAQLETPVYSSLDMSMPKAYASKVVACKYTCQSQTWQSQQYQHSMVYSSSHTDKFWKLHHGDRTLVVFRATAQIRGNMPLPMNSHMVRALGS